MTTKIDHPVPGAAASGIGRSTVDGLIHAEERGASAGKPLLTGICLALIADRAKSIWVCP